MMEKASRRSWTENENSTRTMHLREYTPREFREIFVDDGPFGADACFRHVNVQSDAVFSYAMTIMDEIHGWKDEEKRVGSKFAARMWIYTEEALTKGQLPNPAMEEYLRKRMLSIMLCTGCALALSLITSVRQKAQFPSMWKKLRAWNWSTRDWDSVLGTMEHVVVFSTCEVEWYIGKTRFEN